MILLNGKKLSEEILRDIKKEVEIRRLKLKLAVIQIGENQVSSAFIGQKEKACQRVGINFELFNFSPEIGLSDLKSKIKKIAANYLNSGIIIQLPLPKKFITEELLNLIPEEKDADVLSGKSLGKFYQGTLSVLPPTVQGILGLLRKYKISLQGKDIVILGAGRLVGFPLALQLLKEKATVSVLNEFSKDTPSFTKKADILISAVGKPNLIKGDMVKKGAIVIDAGNSIEKGRSSGDVDFQSVSGKASYITPVPGGVGPMTVACLLENLVKLNK
ncbi:MAG: hypothetical protein A3A08_02900 [Candidatus Nealsonbacteria bacterium RIFCSPLOWO2_01_FULL_41_9]|uniref:Bifunctional protein FolD n=1 Tax=Candidatus Nealsonbacteria bacterium RIFCSPLOWO2_01_FULL_41_9 TaxID=1801671 RepID=A0A1G2ED99_9BACT|nr:MAG: hypothetical protein A3A08_02900 [Candidatus Nealsonbacteria bacterium RIFCSPLOWO2_01_FULL_41_9]